MGGGYIFKVCRENICENSTFYITGLSFSEIDKKRHFQEMSKRENNTHL